jgi:hypothetical protein
LLGISGSFLALSAFFLSKSLSIIDYGEAYIGEIGCDSCAFNRESLLLNALIFAIIASIPGGVGVQFVITSYRALKKQAGIAKD